MSEILRISSILKGANNCMRNKTLLTSALFAKEGEAFASVALPHTWNALDGQDGGADYWRGIGTYKIDLPNPTAGKKQYIEIQGANHVATVYCNGRELGTHKGGFSTFRYDLTPAMKAEGNVLTVTVTNAPSDIYPQNADFTFYGGLYRDVNFIEVNDAHFDLLLDGTDAVFVTPHNVGKTRVDLFPVNADGCTVNVELKDAEGNVVGTASTAAVDHAHVLIDVNNPHLWQGLECVRCGELRDNPFTDVSEGAFYYDPVMWAIENGVTNGMTPTTFGPNDQCMRAQVVTFLWRAAGSPEPIRTENPFVDVKEGDFYYKPVLWAVENGITSGMDATHFGPTAYCNRAQVVTFLYRTMGSPDVADSANPFADVAAGSFYEGAVLWAVENGITNGLSATSFGPNTVCNRAQIVTFLYRAFGD